jgi:hypothetical protein
MMDWISHAQRWDKVVDFGSPMTAWTPEMLAQRKEKKMSFKPEVQVGSDPKWYGNSVAFATREEAEYSAKDLYNRWGMTTAWRAVESDEPVNYHIDLNTGWLTGVEVVDAATS